MRNEAFSVLCLDRQQIKITEGNNDFNGRRVSHRHIISSQNTIGSAVLSVVNKARSVRASLVTGIASDRDVVCLITGHRRRRQRLVSLLVRPVAHRCVRFTDDATLHRPE